MISSPSNNSAVSAGRVLRTSATEGLRKTFLGLLKTEQKKTEDIDATGVFGNTFPEFQTSLEFNLFAA